MRQKFTKAQKNALRLAGIGKLRRGGMGLDKGTYLLPVVIAQTDTIFLGRSFDFNLAYLRFRAFLVSDRRGDDAFNPKSAADRVHQSVGLN